MSEKKSNSGLIKSGEIVKIKKVRDEIEIKKISICNRRPVVRRLYKGRHINISTGEIIEDKITTQRGQSWQSLRASNMALKDLIKENTIDCKKLLLLTLTYSEKTLDFDMIVNDFKVFMNKVRKTYTDFGAIEYINVIELYEDRKGYHIHAILFCNDSTKNVFMPINEVLQLWGHGNIQIGQPTKQRDVYYYLTPHLVEHITDKNKHMHLKAILQMELPAGQKLYRTSKGIKRPQIYTDNYEKIKQFLKENNYEYTGRQIYPSPLKGYHGNPLYYCNENYKQKPPASPETPDDTN